MSQTVADPPNTFDWDVLKNKKKKKKRAETVTRVATARWREPVSWDKTRNARRALKKETQEEPVSRKSNHTLNNARQRYYTTGEGQQGIGISSARATRMIQRAVKESLEELKELDHSDVTQSRFYIWTDFVEPIRAALDQHINVILELAAYQASAKYSKKSNKKRKRGLKCRAADVEAAINILKSLSK